MNTSIIDDQVDTFTFLHNPHTPFPSILSTETTFARVSPCGQSLDEIGLNDSIAGNASAGDAASTINLDLDQTPKGMNGGFAARHGLRSGNSLAVRFVRGASGVPDDSAEPHTAPAESTGRVGSERAPIVGA